MNNNSAPGLVARYDYDPYVRPTLVTGSNLSDFQYAGMNMHQTSGLYLTKYRDYDPNTARWLARDPLGEGVGNLYGYADNEPINLLDSLGLDVIVTPADKSDYDAAKTYLSKDPGMKKILDDLRTSPTKFKLITNSTGDDHLDPSDNSIHWDSHSALTCTKRGGTQSPALGLGHEGDHADEYDKSPTKANKDTTLLTRRNKPWLSS